ncbi:TetR family transcriptional regulator [candidate division KSB1 bacterium]|nr:TetR family transcriptional regulator [candidate division KSB1 bacterium]
MTEAQLSTRDKILHAALDVFVSKGKDGARMQEIADLAGVNKAMLFYYFTNKDLLYAEVFRSNIMEMIANIKTIIISADEPDKKIEQIVNAYVSFFADHPDLPRLILREVANDPESVKAIIREIKDYAKEDIPMKFIGLLHESISEQNFYHVDPKQTIISIVGMCIIYFIGKPIIEVLLDIEDVDPQEFIEQRKQNILFLLKNGLLYKEEK